MSSPLNIAVVVGSIRKDSYNRRFAEALAKLAPDGVKFNFLRIDDLPHYDQDDDADNAPEVRRLKAEVEAADGVLFVTPEYNRSYSGVLKNAIDQASRPYGQAKWKGKPAAIVTVSYGPLSGAMAAQHLRNVLAVLDMPTLNQPEMYIQWKDGLVDEQGNVGPASKAPRPRVSRMLRRVGEAGVMTISCRAMKREKEKARKPDTGTRRSLCRGTSLKGTSH